MPANRCVGGGARQAVGGSGRDAAGNPVHVGATAVAWNTAGRRGGPWSRCAWGDGGGEAVALVGRRALPPGWRGGRGARSAARRGAVLRGLESPKGPWLPRRRVDRGAD